MMFEGIISFFTRFRIRLLEDCSDIARVKSDLEKFLEQNQKNNLILATIRMIAGKRDLHGIAIRALELLEMNLGKDTFISQRWYSQLFRLYVLENREKDFYLKYIMEKRLPEESFDYNLIQGWFHARRQAYEDAFHYFKKIKISEVEYSHMRLIIADTYFKVGRLREAEDLYLEARKIARNEKERNEIEVQLRNCRMEMERTKIVTTENR